LSKDDELEDDEEESSESSDSMQNTFSFKCYLTLLALCANFIDESVSYRLIIEGLSVIIM